MSVCEELEYPHMLLDYMQGFLVSRVVFTACELGVFDLLHEVQEPTSAATIATRLSTSVEGMEQLLDACVGMKLLKVDLRNNEGYYSNTDVSAAYLVKSSPRSLYHMMMYFSKTVSMGWNYITGAIREGRSRYDNEFELSSPEGSEAILRSEDEMVALINFMDSAWHICGKDVLQAFDLSAFHTVCDIGGCSGGLAKHLVSTYESTVTIMDLPRVIQTAKKHFVTDHGRIHFLEGNFFTDPIPQADLYILARIIHDLSEEKGLQLLRKIHQSCRPGGGVLLVETILNEDRSGPRTAQLSSLYMFVHTEGKQRTLPEYTKLLTDAGFRDIDIKITGKMYDAVLGRK